MHIRDFSKTGLLALTSLFTAMILACASLVFAQERDVASDVRQIMLEIVHEDELSRVERLKAYSDASNVAMSDIGTILMTFASQNPDSLAPGTEEYVLFKFSLEVLGDMEFVDAKPRLVELTQSDNGIIRSRAIRSLIRIGGQDLLVFANDVVADTSRFDDLDRYALFEDLKLYVDAQKYVRDSIRIEDVRAFYQSALSSEKEQGCRRLLQKITRDLAEREQR